MKLLLVLVVGIFVGVGGLYSAQMSGFIGNDKESSASSDEGNPLYWVAPMDPNYRRDQPGKSPMGMDLIPVYAKVGETQVQAP
jgi:Cu(I)/Ag(I) efflux system membrane fusion protein